jgi:MFS family permease
MPFMMTVAVSKADASNRGVYTGIYSASWAAAFILAPVIGSFIVTHWGFSTLWWCLGAFSAILTLAVRYIVPKVY